MYKLGCKILMITGILFIIIGLYGVLFNTTSLFSIINWIMDPNFWWNEKLSNGTLKFKIFTWDFLGMLHIIWGINIFYVTKYGLMNKKESWAWRCILFSVITLLLVDIHLTLSINHNTFISITIFFVILFIIPLIMKKDVLKRSIVDDNNKKS